MNLDEKIKQLDKIETDKKEQKIQERYELLEDLNNLVETALNEGKDYIYIYLSTDNKLDELASKYFNLYTETNSLYTYLFTKIYKISKEGMEKLEKDLKGDPITSNIWFTSDLHLGHDKEFIYKDRGFTSIEEHDIYIIYMINEYVKENDELYILGDLILKDNDKGLEYLQSIKCKNIHIILGNHDSETRIELYKTLPNVVEITYATVLKYKKNSFYLSHYPTITTNYDDDKPWHKNLINLYGHTHQQYNFYYSDNPMLQNGNPYMYHVGIDSHECKPVSIDEIIEEIKKYKCSLDNSNLTI